MSVQPLCFAFFRNSYVSVSSWNFEHLSRISRLDILNSPSLSFTCSRFTLSLCLFLGTVAPKTVKARSQLEVAVKREDDDDDVVNIHGLQQQQHAGIEIEHKFRLEWCDDIDDHSRLLVVCNTVQHTVASGTAGTTASETVAGGTGA